MSVKEQAARGGIWYAAISLSTQVMSWAFTFYVIRLLDPQDYGLMNMAAFLTAYLQVFSGLGLGAAIVQRETIEDDDVNSVFWFSLAVGIGMAVVAFLLAYPTAWLFEEPRVVPVTQLIGLLFIISALTTVPYNLLSRRFELKKVATINLASVVVSSTVSLILALNGFGVYTLIWANVTLNGTKMILLFLVSGWRPRLHYAHAEVKPYLSYGIYLALSSASLRLFQSLDKLVIGRLFGATQLGLYGNALTIANMPIDKIWPIYQQVSFPLFSRLQDRIDECYMTYLAIARHYLLLVSPIYMGCMAVAPELIRVVLGEKWAPMAGMFQVFCVVKLFEVLTAYHTVLFNATGRHKNVFWFHAALVVVIPGAVFFAGLHSFEAIMLPWLILYPALCVIWLVDGMRKAQLSIRAYLKAVFDGTKAALCMLAVLTFARHVSALHDIGSDLARLILYIVIGVATVGAVLLIFQRDLLADALRTLRGKAT